MLPLRCTYQQLTQLSCCVPQCCLQRQRLEADAERLRGEYESVVAAQQERAAEWEAAAKRNESVLSARQQVC